MFDLIKPDTTLIELNDHNGASKVCYEYAEKCLTEFDIKLYGVQMGIAYGGGIERMAKLWRDRGEVYGYDVFEDTHPTHLAEDANDREATCMEHWYRPEVYGTDRLSLEYQKGVLEAGDLWNAHLIKGEVHKDSCKELPYINYAFLDMDLIVSMEYGYKAVKDKIIRGGYLLLHDVVTTSNLPKLHDWYHNKILGEDGYMWEVLYENAGSHLAVLKRTNLTGGIL